MNYPETHHNNNSETSTTTTTTYLRLNDVASMTNSTAKEQGNNNTILGGLTSSSSSSSPQDDKKKDSACVSFSTSISTSDGAVDDSPLRKALHAAAALASVAAVAGGASDLVASDDFTTCVVAPVQEVVDSKRRTQPSRTTRDAPISKKEEGTTTTTTTAIPQQLPPPVRQGPIKPEENVNNKKKRKAISKSSSKQHAPAIPQLIPIVPLQNPYATTTGNTNAAPPHFPLIAGGGAPGGAGLVMYTPNIMMLPPYQHHQGGGGAAGLVPLSVVRPGFQYNPSMAPIINRETEVPLVFRERPQRSGKWTREEERYAELLIELFEKGHIDEKNGSTLRSYLSRKLHCAPMRISKKYAGKGIGKMVFLCKSGYRDKKGDGIGSPVYHANMQRLQVAETNFYKSCFPDCAAHLVVSPASILAAGAASQSPGLVLPFPAGQANSMVQHLHPHHAPPPIVPNAAGGMMMALPQQQQSNGPLRSGSSGSGSGSSNLVQQPNSGSLFAVHHQAAGRAPGALYAAPLPGTVKPPDAMIASSYWAPPSCPAPPPPAIASTAAKSGTTPPSSIYFSRRNKALPERSSLTAAVPAVVAVVGVVRAPPLTARQTLEQAYAASVAKAIAGGGPSAGTTVNKTHSVVRSTRDENDVHSQGRGGPPAPYYNAGSGSNGIRQEPSAVEHQPSTRHVLSVTTGTTTAEMPDFLAGFDNNRSSSSNNNNNNVAGQQQGGDPPNKINNSARVDSAQFSPTYTSRSFDDLHRLLGTNLSPEVKRQEVLDKLNVPALPFIYNKNSSSSGSHPSKDETSIFFPAEAGAEGGEVAPSSVIMMRGNTSMMRFWGEQQQQEQASFPFVGTTSDQVFTPADAPAAQHVVPMTQSHDEHQFMLTKAYGEALSSMAAGSGGACCSSDNNIMSGTPAEDTGADSYNLFAQQCGFAASEHSAYTSGGHAEEDGFPRLFREQGSSMMMGSMPMGMPSHYHQQPPEHMDHSSSSRINTVNLAARNDYSNTTTRSLSMRNNDPTLVSEPSNASDQGSDETQGDTSGSGTDNQADANSNESDGTASDSSRKKRQITSHSTTSYFRRHHTAHPREQQQKQGGMDHFYGMLLDGFNGL